MGNEVVLDSSAVIALLEAEPGSERVQARLESAAITTVNVAEIGDYALRHGGTRTEIDRAIGELHLDIVQPDMALALDAAALLRPTRPAGLSLGDRFCLALAKRLGRPALTADRAWASVATAIDAHVELIR